MRIGEKPRAVVAFVDEIGGDKSPLAAILGLGLLTIPELRLRNIDRRIGKTVGIDERVGELVLLDEGLSVVCRGSSRSRLGMLISPASCLQRLKPTTHGSLGGTSQLAP